MSDPYREYIARRPLVLAALASLGSSACGDSKPRAGSQNLPSPAQTTAEMPKRALGKTGIEVSAVGLLEQAIATAVGFEPLSDEQRVALLARTAQAAKDGAYEKFKTSEKFDGTSKNPKWLEKAEL